MGGSDSVPAELLDTSPHSFISTAKSCICAAIETKGCRKQPPLSRETKTESRAVQKIPWETTAVCEEVPVEEKGPGRKAMKQEILRILSSVEHTLRDCCSMSKSEGMKRNSIVETKPWAVLKTLLVWNTSTVCEEGPVNEKGTEKNYAKKELFTNETVDRICVSEWKAWQYKTRYVSSLNSWTKTILRSWCTDARFTLLFVIIMHLHYGPL